MTQSNEIKETETDGKSGRELLPRTVPSHLLMVSILEQLCLMYAKDEFKGKELFKGNKTVEIEKYFQTCLM